MALQYWTRKKCGNCGHVSSENLPMYTCQQCSTVCCPVCGVDSAVDEDGNMYICMACAMKRMPTVPPFIRVSE